MNLEGSGASTPNHTHVHFLPMKFGPKNKRQKSIISDLLKCMGKGTTKKIGKVYLTEIIDPTWGFILDVKNLVSEDHSSGSVNMALKIARVIQVGVYRAITLSSNHEFGFSLVLDSAKRFQIVVLVRRKELERPFSATSILDQLEFGLANKLRTSAEATWKWGWLECLGGLKLDESRSHAQHFEDDEWHRVLKNLKPSETRRLELLDRVEMALKWLQTAT